MKALFWGLFSIVAFASVTACNKVAEDHAETEMSEAKTATEKALIDTGFNAAAVPEMLSRALSSGDKASVQALLDDKVLIFESGGVESSFAEYAEHHMPSDMAFLKGMSQQRLSQQMFEFDDHVLIASLTRVNGTFNEKPVELMSTETLLLQRSDDEQHWRIRHIHWSAGKPH